MGIRSLLAYSRFAYIQHKHKHKLSSRLNHRSSMCLPDSYVLTHLSTCLTYVF